MKTIITSIMLIFLNCGNTVFAQSSDFKKGKDNSYSSNLVADKNESADIMQDDEFINEFINQGYDLYEQKFYSVAEIYFKEAMDEGSLEAAFFMGMCKFYQEEYIEAIDYFERVLELEDDAAYYNIGLCYFNLGRYDECINYLTQYKSRHADDYNSIYYIGICKYELGGETDGVSLILKAASCGHSNAQLWMGNYHYILGHYFIANEWWEKAAEQENPDAIYNLAVNFYLLSEDEADIKKGMELLVKAAELDCLEAKLLIQIYLQQIEAYEIGTFNV